MKTIIRSFISVLRRFKMATVLNILGLSVVFAAFYIIIIQVDYDRNFDASHPDADCVFRLEAVFGEAEAQCIINRPLSEAFFQSSSHIKAGALTAPWGGNQFLSVERKGEKMNYMEMTTRVTPDFVKVFHFNMIEGETSVLTEPSKVLLPESMAKKFFDGESALGKRLDGNGYYWIVGGVYKDFPINSSVKNVIYYPMDLTENTDNWGNWNYCVFIKLDSPDVADEVIENFKNNNKFEKLSWEYFNLRLTPLSELHFVTNVTYDPIEKSSKQTIAVLFAIAIVIIIIAGINFTNFSTALTPLRVKSINTQKVLGASEGMLRFSLLLEAIAISILSWIIALGIIYILSKSPFVYLVNANMVFSAHYMLLGFSFLLSILVGLLAGIYPSFYTTSFSPALVLKGSFGLSPKGRHLRNALIGIQFMASFALIVSSLFMYLQNHYMQHSPMGYDKEEVIVTSINDVVNKNRETFSNQLKSYSGIGDVTYAYPLLGSQDQYMGWGRPYKDKEINYQCLPVAYNFLEVMNVQVLEGRNFRIEDELTTNGGYIFNQRAKEEYGLELGDKVGGSEIVGFMPDVKFASFRTVVTPMAFYVWGTENWGQTPNFAYIKVKSGADMHAAMEHVKKTLKEFDPEYPFNPMFYDYVFMGLYTKELMLSLLITIFSLIAVFISIVGVFGLVVFESEYRRKEIGIRKVMGSTTKQILIMFNKTYIRILFICFVVSSPVAYYAVKNWLENFAYRTPMYWWVFLIAFALVFVITLFTVTFQNWRAANENPVNSIKSE